MDDAGEAGFVGGARQCVVLGRDGTAGIGADAAGFMSDCVQCGGARDGDKQTECVNAGDGADRSQSVVKGHGWTLRG